jgi:hypothetical protein
VNAAELFDALASMAGARDAGTENGIAASRLVNGVEYARVESGERVERLDT